MKTKTLFLTAVCIAFAACDNSVENLPNQEEGSVQKTTFSKMQNSTEKAATFLKYLNLEYEEYFADTRGETSSPKDYSNEVNEKFADYDFSQQQVITSNYKEGKVYLVQNRNDQNSFLSFYEDSNGNVLNIKKINISVDKNYTTVAITKIDDTKYITLGGNSDDREIQIISYNNQILNLSPAQTRNGCSASIGAAGIIWSTGFGMVNPLAGVAVAVCFLAMSEIMC